MFKRFKIKKWLLPIIIATVLSIGALRMVVTWAESGDIWSLNIAGTDVVRVDSDGTFISADVAITGGTITGITALTVPAGGIGASTLTDGGVLLGSGTGAITPMAVLADGSIIIGDGATDPVALAAFSSSTGYLLVTAGGLGLASPTDHAVLLGSGATAVTALTVGTDNQILCGVTSADPSFRVLVDADVPDTLTIGSSSVMTSPPAIGGTAPNIVSYLTEVVDCDTDTAVLAANSGAVYTNAGATTAVIYTLPTASAGLTFLFSSVETDTTLDMTITAASGDKINGGAAAGSYAAASTEEKRACTIIAVDATNWRVISEVGTWAN